MIETMNAEDLENIVCIGCEQRDTCKVYCGAFRFIMECTKNNGKEHGGI